METNVKDYIGSDNERIEQAIAACGAGGRVVIEGKADGSPYLLDRAILLPSDTTVILRNCRLKLSDACRDNFFRTANCGLGIADPAKIRNVHILGEGLCVLEGADHPRAVGDGGKKLADPCPYLDADLCRLAPWVDEQNRMAGKPSFAEKHDHSFGTDAGKPGESQFGDWRGIGILFANVENFSIRDLMIVDSHGWGISLEACSFGEVEKIRFDMRMSKEIDGMLQNMENQDGIDLRNGCHHITVSDISGQTGDDVIALTAIADTDAPEGGSLRSTHVMHNDWTRRAADIHDVIIRNVCARSNLCAVVRLLSVNTTIRNVIIDGVIDTNPDGHPTWTTIVLGERDSGYGKNLPDGLRNILISNVICNSGCAITVGGYLKDSAIANVINRDPKAQTLRVKRENGLNNVSVTNMVTAQVGD